MVRLHAQHLSTGDTVILLNPRLSFLWQIPIAARGGVQQMTVSPWAKDLHNRREKVVGDRRDPGLAVAGDLGRVHEEARHSNTALPRTSLAAADAASGAAGVDPTTHDLIR